MLKKNDCLIILTDLQDKGIDVGAYLTKLLASPDIPSDVIKFINDNRQFDVANFYETIRKNYNHKKSSLYKNIVREDIDPQECLTTLGALNLQILLFSKKLENKQLFLSHSRAEEITRVLNNYYRTYDLIPCMALLKLIKADLKIFESIK